MLVEKEGLTHGRSITNNYIKELKGNKAGTYHRLLINLSLKETEERSGFTIVCKGKGHSTEINQEIVYLKNVFYTKLLEISDEKISLGVQ